MDDGTEDRFIRGAFGRRAVLRGGALALGGVAAAALIGCGGDDDDGGDEAPPSSTAGNASATAEAVPFAGQNPAQVERDPDLPFPYGLAEPNKEPKAGGEVRVAVTWDVSTMDPTKSGAGGTITVPNVGYDRLISFASGIHYDPLKLELLPGLAASWERSPDGMVYTFKIRPDVKWQNVAPLNGRQFVAADAAFAFERYRTEGVHTSIWAEADKLEAPDASTLKITLKKPLADFLNNLGGRYQTIFPKELVDSGEIEKKVIGTGPMILKEAIPQQSVSFDKNPDYWKAPVHLDKFTFRIMPDAQARVAAFRAGQIEYAYALVSKLSEVNTVIDTNPDVQVYMSRAIAGGYGFGMNLQHPKFQDVRVRRAISLVQDHDTAIALIFENLGVSGPDQPWTFLFDQMPSYKTGELGEWVKPTGDIAQAKQLLEAAGAADLKIEATYYTYAGYDASRAEVLTDQFRRGGIELTARKTEYTEFNSQWVGGKLAEATTSGWSAPGFDADNYFYNQIHSKSPGNRHKLSDPEIDAWAEEQRVELDEDARSEVLRKIWDRIHTDQMYRVSQAGGFAFDVQQPWLRGWRGAGGPVGTSSYFYDWGEQIPDMWIDK